MSPTKNDERYWLVKSEPDVFSFDDLMKAPKKTTSWDGVRNFKARNYLRDEMKLGDRVFFYHSNVGQEIVGICEVTREGYPDPTALDPKHPHFDEGSDPAEPRWFMVDLAAVDRLAHPVTLQAIKKRKELANMTLVRVGRLSVSPVTPAEWKVILEMSKSPA